MSVRMRYKTGDAHRIDDTTEVFASFDIAYEVLNRGGNQILVANLVE